MNISPEKDALLFPAWVRKRIEELREELNETHTSFHNDEMMLRRHLNIRLEAYEEVMEEILKRGFK